MELYENNPVINTPADEKEITVSRISPSVFATDEREKSTFSTIRQGTATNVLTKVRPNTKRNTTIDPVTGTATIKEGNLTITIPAFTTDNPSFRTSTYQLLDALTVALTESGANSKEVTLPLKEFMEKRGLVNERETRKQVKDDLETLFNARISFKESRGKGREADYEDVRIIGRKGIRNSIITVAFWDDFYNILVGYPVMPYPVQLFRLNSKRNPNSFYLLRKITELKNLNAGKKNEDIISVPTLLKSSPYFPTYEEVMATDRHINQRIIEPFERDMNALNDTLTWHYCHANDTPLTEEELKEQELHTMPYDFFTKLRIKVTWRDYPDQTARLERRAKKIEAAKARKEAEQKRSQKKKKADK